MCSFAVHLFADGSAHEMNQVHQLGQLVTFADSGEGRDDTSHAVIVNWPVVVWKAVGVLCGSDESWKA